CQPAVASVTIPNWLPNNFGAHWSQIVPGDFNGDGKMDLLVVMYNGVPNHGGSCSTAGVFESTGTGLKQTSFTVPADWCQYEIVAGDCNGDGKPDIALIPPGVPGLYGPGQPISIWLSTGTGFVQVKTIANQDTFSGTPANPPTYYLAGYVADWNSDGADDLWL